MKVIRNARSCAVSFLGSLILLGCHHDMVGQANVPPGDRPDESPPKSWSLTATHTNVAQQIRPGLADIEKQKFVQIELTSIDNPDKKPLIFEVFFQPENGSRSFLGTFSPYPPDNPGKFIVPTKGLLRGGGSVILSMILPDSGEAKRPMKVEVNKFTFREK